MKRKDKPSYVIPSMDDVRAVPWNGLRVASTFSGAGGSCLGYRMAGYRVVWANEFVPEAQTSYLANASGHSYLDKRDVKIVQPDEILERTGLGVGELDIFDGSPPCQAFSTAGRRHRGWGEDKEYEHGAIQKNETLFDEYVRLLRGLKPKVFLAENVKGLITGTSKGYFLEILAALKASGYRVKCRLLNAQWLGVPQNREHTIFVGVREDLKLDPVHPAPFGYSYTVSEALPWILKAVHETGGQYSVGDITHKPSPTIMAVRTVHFVDRESAISGDRERIYDLTKPGKSFADGAKKVGKDGWYTHTRASKHRPSPAITAYAQTYHPDARRKFTIEEAKRICSFPDDFVLTGGYAQQWARLGNSVPPLMMMAIAKEIRTGIFDKLGVTSP